MDTIQHPNGYKSNVVYSERAAFRICSACPQRKGIVPIWVLVYVALVPIDTDAYNKAIAAILTREFEDQDFGEMRMVRATGIPRSSLGRYLDGTRPIPVAKFRLIAAALGIKPGVITDKADAQTQ